MQTSKKIILSSDYRKQSNKMNYYPITSRNFPICADYYNPLSLLMDNVHYLFLRLITWEEQELQNKEFIKYNLHGIYQTGHVGKEEEIAVVVSAIPRKLINKVREATYGHTYSEEALKTYCRNLSFVVSNTIYVNEWSSDDYIYKADVFHREGIVNVLKAIYHQELHKLETLDAYVLSSYACMNMDNTNYMVDDDIIKTTKPEHFQIYKDLLRKQPTKFKPILLPHIDYKNELLEYLKKKYLLDDTTIHYIDQHHLYYRKDMGKEFELPDKVEKEIENTVSSILRYMARRGLTFSALDIQMSKHKETTWHLSQYPLSNLLRFIDTGSIKADSPFAFIRKASSLEDKTQSADIYFHYPSIPFKAEGETTNPPHPHRHHKQ